MTKLKVTNAGGAEEYVDIDRKPDVCPLCHHAVDPRQHPVCVASGALFLKGSVIEVVYQCTRHKCLRLFVGRYRRTTSQGDKLVGPFKLQEVTPSEFTLPDVPSELDEISPSFKEIYCQAVAAENYHLSEIAGLGYRKALEFLVKDFCIHKQPDEAENIQKEALGSTIANRIEDSNVKECARRAAWLGNDEAHYVRRWKGRDINDLKVLIELTSNWIRNCILTETYLREMENS